MPSLLPHDLCNQWNASPVLGTSHVGPGSPISIRVSRESYGLLSSHCRANRPHLDLCSETNVPLQGRQGSRGCSQDSPGESGLVEWKQRTLLSSRVSTGISWSPLSALKGVKPPVEFGERTPDCFPVHAGKEGPHLAMTGASRGFYRAAAPAGSRRETFHS